MRRSRKRTKNAMTPNTHQALRDLGIGELRQIAGGVVVITNPGGDTGGPK